MRVGGVGLVLLVVGVVGCSGSGSERDAGAISGPAASTTESPPPTSVPSPDGRVVATSRAAATGLSSPNDVRLPSVEQPALVRQYLSENSGLATLHQSLGVLVAMQDVSPPNCEDLATQLELAGSPAELQVAAAGVPDVVGAELYSGMVSAAGDVLRHCGDAGFDAALSDLSWQWLLLERWREDLS